MPAIVSVATIASLAQVGVIGIVIKNLYVVVEEDNTASAEGTTTDIDVSS